LKINQEKHSAYPVCKNNSLDNITGIVLLKDLFSVNEGSFSLKDVMKQPLFISKNTFAYKLLEMFKQEKMHYGIVLDEYGITQGIVTMDDVIDALVGDVTEHNQDEYKITQRDDDTWLVDGQFPVIEFAKYFGLAIDNKNNFVTIAGLFMNDLSQLPDVGDKVIINELELEIMDKDGQRIDKILVKKIN
jgi:putative hemolysin